MSGAPAIVVEGLTKYYGAVIGIEDLSLGLAACAHWCFGRRDL